MQRKNLFNIENQNNIHFPKVIVSSVVRAASIGESHGSVYILDLNTEESIKLIDWKDEDIDFSGRGGERGLRGIAFYKDNIYIAAASSIIILDKDFKIIKEIKNKYLSSCHEICIDKDRLYISSTGINSIVVFDLVTEQFIKSYHIQKKFLLSSKSVFTQILRKIGLVKTEILKKFKEMFREHKVVEFDPNDDKLNIKMEDHNHLNNVHVKNGDIYFSCKGLSYFFCIKGNKAVAKHKIPFDTHNPQFYKDKIVLNSTGNNSVCVQNLDGEILDEFDIYKYDINELENNDSPDKIARQAFGRGLCVYGNYLIGGSSPSTISIYSLKEKRRVKHINISMNIKNAIHGLEVLK